MKIVLGSFNVKFKMFWYKKNDGLQNYSYFIQAPPLSDAMHPLSQIMGGNSIYMQADLLASGVPFSSIHRIIQQG